MKPKKNPWKNKSKDGKPKSRPKSLVASHFQRGTKFDKSPKKSSPSHFESPWVWLSLNQPNPLIWRKTVKASSEGIVPGELVHVYGPDAELIGSGLYAPRSQHCLRILRRDGEPFSKNWMRSRLTEALDYRLKTLKLDEVTNAYRVIHAEGDEFPGLMIDRFNEVLSIEIFTEGWLSLLPEIIPVLHNRLGTSCAVARADSKAKQVEHFRMDTKISGTLPKKVTVEEHGVKFRVDVKGGHKTGFFCDQRDNRLELTKFTKDRSVLDICTYTGGFALAAKTKGQAKEVIGVDLDEKALAMAKTNAGLNQTNLQWVRAEAFAYMRQMQENKREFDVVVLDPPKFIPDRKSYDEGRRKYLDFNKLGLSLVKPGGLFVTCSCSGLLSSQDLIEIAQSAERSASNTGNKRLRLMKMTGAGADHPARMNCLESSYLKAAWFHVT